MKKHPSPSPASQRSQLHDVMRTRHGGAHRKKQDKRQPSKARRYLKDAE